MRSWKTTLFAVLSIGSYVAGHFLPEHKEFFNGLSSMLVGGGLFAAKDFNISGGTGNGRLLDKYGDQCGTNLDQTGSKEPCDERVTEKGSVESKGSN